MTQSSSKKKHASFQSNYRRSLNFRHSAKKETFVLNEKGELVLGQWQSLMLCDFDGPRERRVVVKVLRDIVPGT